MINVIIIVLMNKSMPMINTVLIKSIIQINVVIQLLIITSMVYV